MAKQLSDIKKLIERGETDTAINALTNFIGNHQGSKDEAYYLLGNAYRKKGDWQQALNNYLEAIERNPESPAVQAQTMLMDILNFYNKGRLNYSQEIFAILKQSNKKCDIITS